MTVRRLSLALTLVALLVPAAAQAGSIWTPVASGTTDTISSVVYQSPTRFWYAASNGDVWQTSNGGVSWTPVPPPQTPADCSSGSPVAAETELNAVVWSSTSTVYLLGNNSTVQKSTAANTPTPAFSEINKVGTGTCAAQSDTSAQNLTDATF